MLLLRRKATHINVNLNLNTNETKLIGEWIVDGKSVPANDSCIRIEWLVNNVLENIELVRKATLLKIKKHDFLCVLKLIPFITNENCLPLEK